MNQSNSNKGKYVTWVFLPLILAFIIQLALELMGLQGIMVYVMASFKGGSFSDFNQEVMGRFLGHEYHNLFLVTYSIVAILVFGYIYKKMFRSNQKYKPFDTSLNPSMTICGMAILTLALQYICVYVLLSLVVAFPKWYLEYAELLKEAGLDSSLSIPMAIYAVVLGPICEELIFRGVTLSAALKAFPVPIAIILQAVMFGAYHQNTIQGCYTFVFGLALGYVMYLYDDLIVTILIHMVYNIFGTYLSALLPKGGSTAVSYFAWFLGSLIVGYFAIVLLRRASAKVNNVDVSSDI